MIQIMSTRMGTRTRMLMTTIRAILILLPTAMFTTTTAGLRTTRKDAVFQQSKASSEGPRSLLSREKWPFEHSNFWAKLKPQFTMYQSRRSTSTRSER